jgi:hypothetical protein
LVALPGKSVVVTKLIDPQADPPKITLPDGPTDLPNERLLRGRVVDEKQMPIEGALIEPCGAKTLSKQWGGVVDASVAVSDKDGKFAILLPATYLQVDLQIFVDGRAGALRQGLAPGFVEHEIEIPAGTRVTGRLLRDGQPLAGVRLAVVQEDRSSDHHFIKAVGDTTNADGRFAFDHLPADESYVIFSVVGEGPQRQVVTTKRFKAFANGRERDLGDLTAIPAIRLAGRLELSAGTKLPPNTKISLGREPAWDLIAIPVAADGEFEIDGLPPEVYSVRVIAKGLRVDPSRIPYQIIGDSEFALRLKSSKEDLNISLTSGK